MSTPKTPVDSTNARHPRGWPTCDTNDPNITSLIGQKKILRRYLWASTNYEHSTVAPTNYGHPYPTGPNQLWALKENNEAQPIMNTQKKTISPNQLWALKTSGPNQLWAPCDNECMHACDTWLLTQNIPLTMSIRLS